MGRFTPLSYFRRLRQSSPLNLDEDLSAVSETQQSQTVPTFLPTLQASSLRAMPSHVSDPSLHTNDEDSLGSLSVINDSLPSSPSSTYDEGSEPAGTSGVLPTGLYAAVENLRKRQLESARLRYINFMEESTRLTAEARERSVRNSPKHSGCSKQVDDGNMGLTTNGCDQHCHTRPSKKEEHPEHDEAHLYQNAKLNDTVVHPRKDVENIIHKLQELVRVMKCIEQLSIRSIKAEVPSLPQEMNVADGMQTRREVDDQGHLQLQRQTQCENTSDHKGKSTSSNTSDEAVKIDGVESDGKLLSAPSETPEMKAMLQAYETAKQVTELLGAEIALLNKKK